MTPLDTLKAVFEDQILLVNSGCRDVEVLQDALNNLHMAVENFLSDDFIYPKQDNFYSSLQFTD